MEGEVKYYPEYWVGTELSYPNVAPESPKFARSIVVDNLIFVSGATGQDTVRGTPTSPIFEEQMISALTKIKVAMEEAGSSMDNVIKTLILCKNLEDYPRMRRTELEFYEKHAPYLVSHPPVSTFLQVVSLAKPEFLVEIEATGVLHRG